MAQPIGYMLDSVDLATGTKICPYEIDGLLGADSMGIVIVPCEVIS